MLRTISLALALALLTACGGRWATKPNPPPVSGCIERPVAHVPDEPEAPPEGAPIPDTYVVALKAYANALLGVITVDRLGWRGERKCIHTLIDAGQVR